MICVICLANKEGAEFYRSDVSNPRCKECCKVSRFCQCCNMPKHNQHFKSKSRKCRDCHNGVSLQQQQVGPVVDDYVKTCINVYEAMLNTYGIRCSGIHL